MKYAVSKRSLGNWILALGALVFIGSWLITVMIIKEDRRLEIIRAEKVTMNLSSVIEKHVSALLSHIDNLLVSLREKWASGMSAEEIHSLLENSVASRPELFNLISILDADGKVVVTNRETFKHTNSSDRPHFIKHKTDKSMNMSIAGPVLGRVTGKWHLPVSVRLDDAHGEFAGIILASINPSYFSMIFREVELGQESLVFLLDKHGVVYSGMKGHKELALDLIISPERAAEIFNQTVARPEMRKSLADGVERIGASAFIRDRTMAIAVETGYQEWLEQSKVRTNYLLSLQTLLSLLILLVAFRLRSAVELREAASSELDRFFSSSLDLFCIADINGRFIRVNQEWAKNLGYSIVDLESRKFLDFVHPDDLQATLECIKKLGNQNEVFDFTNRYLCKDGSYRWLEWRSTPFGNLIYAAARDITQRRQDEMELRESKERFKLLHNASFGGIAIHDQGKIIECNLGLAELSGYSHDELIGMNGLLLCSEKSRDLLMEKIQAGVEEPYEAIGLRKNGEEYCLRIEARQIPYKGKNVRVTEFRDISAQKKAEEALRLSEERFQIFMSMSPVYAYIKDSSLTHIYKNQKVTDLLVLAGGENYDNSAHGAMNADTAKMVETADRKILEGIEGRIELEYSLLVNSEPVWIKDIKFRLSLPDGRAAVGGLAFDITAQKRAEEEQIRLQKMEGLGTLAGGIAHDFNNLLMALFGNITMARLQLPEDLPATQFLDEAEKAMDRATRLTRQLLTFAKGGEPVRHNTNIGDLVKEAVCFDLSGRNVQPIFSGFKDLWPVMVDKGQMQQVFSNLVINSVQAMPGGGKIFVDFENAIIHEGEVGSLPTGKYVRIKFRDEGSGIDPKFVSRIFDPYFTTKQTGSGLGLATTHSIIRKHGGYIGIESLLGQGTTFIIHLPASDSQNESGSREPRKENTRAVRKGEILVLDDEEVIRILIVELLQSMGHTATTVADGEEAIKKYRQAFVSGKPYDIVIMDLTVPGGMGGKDAIVEILKIDPKARCIVSSGYSTDPVMANFADYGFKGVAEKPYSLEKLADLLQQILQQ